MTYHDISFEYDLSSVVSAVNADMQLVFDDINKQSSDEDVRHDVNKVTPPSPPQRSERMIIDIDNNDVSELDDASVTRLTNSADTVTPMKSTTSSNDNAKMVDSDESRKRKHIT